MAKKTKKAAKGAAKSMASAAKTVKNAAKKAASKVSTPSSTPAPSAPAAAAPAAPELTTTQMANNAVDMLRPILDGLKVNNLDAYISPTMRQDFIRDENYIRSALNNATNAAYDVNRAQALQDAINAEDTSYANTKNAIAEMRRNLVGSGSSGANVGAANATALQALLGANQQNAETTTEGLRNINNVSRERASQIAQNAVDAINQANDATAKMYDAATSAYGSDRSYAAQGAAEAVGNLASAVETGASNERATAATNAANERMNQYTADTGLAGTKYSADSSVKAAKAGANTKSTVTTVDGGKKSKSSSGKKKGKNK